MPLSHPPTLSLKQLHPSIPPPSAITAQSTFPPPPPPPPPTAMAIPPSPLSQIPSRIHLPSINTPMISHNLPRVASNINVTGPSHSQVQLVQGQVPLSQRQPLPHQHQHQHQHPLGHSHGHPSGHPQFPAQQAAPVFLQDPFLRPVKASTSYGSLPTMSALTQKISRTDSVTESSILPVSSSLINVTASDLTEESKSSNNEFRKLSIPGASYIVRNSVSSDCASPLSSVGSVTSLEDNSGQTYPPNYFPITLVPVNNGHQALSRKLCNTIDLNGSFTFNESQVIINKESVLPHTSFSIKKEEEEAKEVKIEAKIDNSKFLKDSGLNSIFISNEMNYENVSQLNPNKKIVGYACDFEIFSKLQFFIMNSLTFKLSTDETLRLLVIKIAQYSPLYEETINSHGSLGYLSLYHERHINPKGERIFSFEPNVYLKLSNYHILRSIQSLSQSVKKKETSRRSVCMFLSSVYQTMYFILSPEQKIASKDFLMSFKNQNYLFSKFNSFFKGCDLFCHVVDILNNSQFEYSNVYFPMFLYGVVDVEYHLSDKEGEGEKFKVNQLNLTQRNCLLKAIDDLKNLYSLKRNSFNDDFLSTLLRFFPNINDEFIDLVSKGNPRALIVIGYYIMLLASKNNKLIGKQFYNTEINFLMARMDKFQNSNCWKSWLNPVILMVNDMNSF